MKALKWSVGQGLDADAARFHWNGGKTILWFDSIQLRHR
jgi:hypothetical protein